MEDQRPARPRYVLTQDEAEALALERNRRWIRSSLRDPPYESVAIRDATGRWAVVDRRRRMGWGRAILELLSEVRP